MKKVDIYILKTSIWKVLEYNKQVIRYLSHTVLGASALRNIWKLFANTALIAAQHWNVY